jgi:predicted RND superfamily exporter protein
MPNVRRKIEAGFEDLARLICRRRWPVLGVMFVLVALLAAHIPKLEIDMSNESFLHDDDPILAEYEAFQDQFGREEMIAIALEPPEIFDPDFLAELKTIHEELEAEVPHLADIMSLVNARSTRGEGNTLIVDDLLAEWPDSPARIAELKRRVMDNPLYRNAIISDDGRLTTILLKTDAYSSLGVKETDVLSGFDDEAESAEDPLAGFDEETPTQEGTQKPAFITDKENSEVVAAVRAVLARHHSADLKIDVAGSPVITHTLKRSMLRDMSLFLRLAVLTIGLCLLIMFRRVSGILFPLIVVALALVSTLGLMAWLGTSVKTMTSILPSFLLAVGVGASVHLLAIFYHKLDEKGDRHEAIVHAMGHSGLAIVMTSVTTAAGLASFSTAEVAPIADLGTYSCLGILLTLVLTIVLLPALLAIFPIKPHKPRAAKAGRPVIDRFLGAVAKFSTSHARSITVTSLVIIVLALVGAFRLEFSHDILSWFPSEEPIRVATQKIDDRLKGSISMEIVLDTGRENGLYDPVLLQKMDDLAREIDQLEVGSLFVGRTSSVADILKEIHRALNENDPAFYRIPDNAKLIPQEFLLFENSGSDDLEDFVDSGFSLARFTIKVPWRDALEYGPFLEEIEKRFQETFQDDAQISSTGMIVLFSRIISAAIHSMARSYAIALVLITVLMILLVGRLKMGLASMLPNLFPILVTMGLMYWLGFPLDMFTMLIASIAIGLAVDDTIHFMHNFRRCRDAGDDVVTCVHETLLGTGRAMLVTTVVLSLGFFIFMFSSMNHLFNFGLLTGIAVLLALAADFLLAPALMVLIHPKPAGSKADSEATADMKVASN